MTVIVRTSRGIGTTFAIKQVYEKAGVEPVELRLSWGSSISDAARALAGAMNSRQALLIDIDSGANARLFSTLLACIESKTLAGYSLQAMSGIVVVMPEDEFEDLKNHPLVARSMNIAMSDGSLERINTLAKAVKHELDSAVGEASPSKNPRHHAYHLTP